MAGQAELHQNICADCPLQRVLISIEETFSDDIPQERIENMRQVVARFSAELGNRAVGRSCDGPEVAGAVCGLDMFAEMNNQIQDEFQKNIFPGEF